MKLLIVAPKSNLNTFSEILDATGPGETRVLHGTVTVREVMTEIRTGQFTHIYFAGHGDDQSLMFSDGLLNKALLADSIQAAGAIILVLFNSCQSLGPALAAYGAGVHYVIGWQGNVSDSAAINYAYAFWATYRLSNDVHVAHRTGREAVIFGNPGHETPDLINGRNSGYQQRVESLQAQVSRQRQWLFVLMVTTVASLVIETITLFLMWGT